MSDSEWSKVHFQQFLNDFGNDIVVNTAPTILYSKRDKEHEAYNSLIGFFFITGGLLIYIAIAYFLAPLIFNLILIVIIVIIAIFIDVYLIINYLKSNVYIKPLECWFEIHKGKSDGVLDFYCLTFYPIFSGKCHPNAAMNVIHKLYQEQVLKSKIDTSQIEVYLKLNVTEKKIQEPIGFFFQYGEGKPFKEENIDYTSWKFFSFEMYKNDNYIATANWEHQYEWKDDLEYDYDKLHEYAPWVIQRWDKISLKPLTEEFKEKINWNLRCIDSNPKLSPWKGDLENQTYHNPKSDEELKIIKEAIEKVIGTDVDIEKMRDIKDKILLIKRHFRDLSS
ncbi:MAG: hypothetical protein ACXAEX_06105 [Promethearchaeota archaeon]|jgi:hypothetical protein